jgi:EF hand
MQRARIIASVVTLLVTSLACAQGGAPTTPGAPPAGRPAGGLPGIGSGGAARTIDTSIIVDRFMQGDKNGDGKLTKDELPAPFVDRSFDAADTNKDGGIDRTELTAYMKSQTGGRGETGEGKPEVKPEGRPEGRPEGAPPEARGEGRQGRSFEGGMKQAARGFKAIEKSSFNAESMNADLEAVSAIQAGLANAKGLAGQVTMSEAAKKKFGTDETAFRMDLRKQLIATLKEAIALEEAIMAGKSADAKAAFERLHKAEEAGHTLFKSDDEG